MGGVGGGLAYSTISTHSTVKKSGWYKELEIKVQGTLNNSARGHIQQFT